MTTVTPQQPATVPFGSPAVTGWRGTGRLWLSIGAVLAGLLWVRPLSLHGDGPVVLVVLLLTCGFQLARHLPAAAADSRWVLPLMACWALAAAALLVLRSDSVAPMFAYLMTGYAGYRLPLRTALAVAGATGVLCAVGLRIAEANGVDGWPWLLGLTVALPVGLGMANRSRDQAVNSAIEAARSAQRAAQAEAREQALTERARISRDIHDVLAHSLTGVSMQLELSEMLLEGGDVDQARASITKAHSMVREGMAEARRAVTALRSETLPLRQTLEGQFAGAGQVRVEGSPVELPTEAAQAVVRTAQEALTNARRHAPGAPIEVTLRYSRSDVELQVDNGPAVDPGSTRTGSGMGLIGMRERAALLGGTAAAGPLVSGPMAGGWRVLLRLPLELPPPDPTVGSRRTSMLPENQ